MCEKVKFRIKQYLDSLKYKAQYKMLICGTKGIQAKSVKSGCTFSRVQPLNRTEK